MDDLTVGTLNADDTTEDTAFSTDNIFDTEFGDTNEVVDTPDVSEKLILSDGTEVTLDELERGYLRQSDYTRKTQDLSRQRDELMQAEQLLHALESDPKATLEALQRHLVGDEQGDYEELDPVERELRDHRAFIEQQRAASVQYEVETELAGLAEQYGDFDWNAVLEFAVNREIPDLEAALLLYNKQVERETSRQQANQQVLQAKRGAPPVARGSRAQGTVSESVEINNIMDAWQAAKRELGFE